MGLTLYCETHQVAMAQDARGNRTIVFPALGYRGTAPGSGVQPVGTACVLALSPEVETAGQHHVRDAAGRRSLLTCEIVEGVPGGFTVPPSPHAPPFERSADAAHGGGRGGDRP